jgi:hypothetical protein
VAALEGFQKDPTKLAKDEFGNAAKSAARWGATGGTAIGLFIAMLYGNTQAKLAFVLFWMGTD